jgi:hypothetical protein
MASSYIVGYKYSLGVHMTLCHGPVDTLREIKADDRTAWTVDGTGEANSGAAAVTTIGNFSGIDAEDIICAPGANGATMTIYGTGDLQVGVEYLLSPEGGAPVVIVVQSVRLIADNGKVLNVLPADLAFSVRSVVLSTVPPEEQPTGSGATGGRIVINQPDLFGGEGREGGISGAIDVLMGGGTQTQNDYLRAQAGEQVPAYRGVVSLVLRQVYLGINPYLKPLAVRVSRVLTRNDNQGQWLANLAEIWPDVGDELSAQVIGPDMNPVHILRECITDVGWGMGYNDADIGASFAAAAQVLHDEGFGLSFLWQKEGTVEDFISDVLKHIDASVYVDPRTGLWEIKLIRGDYEIANLPVFDDSNVIDWGELALTEGGQVNQIVVEYSDLRNDKVGTVSVTDTALVQLAGQVISTKISYLGVRAEALAVRLAERDLRALSSAIWSGEITVNRQGSGLAPGAAVRVNSPTRGIDDIVFRVSEVDQGDGRSNGVRLTVAQDVFALGATASVGGAITAPPSLVTAPVALTRSMTQEAPYWAVVQDLGHAAADALLAEEPAAGAVMGAGGRISADATTVQLWADVGAGYAQIDAIGFCPTALLSENLTDDPTHIDVAVLDWTDLSNATTGKIASLGGEFVRIDGLSAAGVTLGRGCLDTVPQAHPAGTPLVLWQDRAAASGADYVAGEGLAAKLLPVTGLGTLPLANAAASAITFDARAIRPLPVGDCRVNGSFTPADDLFLQQQTVTLTWAHRDRTAQTSVVFDDYLAGNVGPELGVIYALEFHWVDPATDALTPAGVDAVGTATTAVVNLGVLDFGTTPAGAAEFTVAVVAQRDVGGVIYTAWQSRRYRFLLPEPLEVSEADVYFDLGAGETFGIAGADLYLEIAP